MRFDFFIDFFFCYYFTLIPLYLRRLITEQLSFTCSLRILPSRIASRLKGHTGNQVFYNTADHYSDNHVLIVAPKNLHADKKVDLIFWFHGWHNNIDTAVAYYQLTRQFIASGINAVLVLPEAAKDAADSYGGKLEKPGVFRDLVDGCSTGAKE